MRPEPPAPLCARARGVFTVFRGTKSSALVIQRRVIFAYLIVNDSTVSYAIGIRTARRYLYLFLFREIERERKTRRLCLKTRKLEATASQEEKKNPRKKENFSLRL